MVHLAKIGTGLDISEFKEILVENFGPTQVAEVWEIILELYYTEDFGLKQVRDEAGNTLKWAKRE